MTTRDIIQQTADYVKDSLSAQSPTSGSAANRSSTTGHRAGSALPPNAGQGPAGHDWWHVYRVWQMAKRIGKDEGADILIVELAALLHDIADWKFHGGDEKAGSRAAHEWLAGQSVDGAIINHVCQIIDDLSFRGAGVHTPMKTREGMVVQDADRLDALGAIGIARAFSYGGYKGRSMYDPDIPPEHHATFEEYKKSAGPTINHFYEKLFLLKDLLNTKTAKDIAGDRHSFMEEYVKRFLQEWNGNE